MPIKVKVVSGLNQVESMEFFIGFVSTDGLKTIKKNDIQAAFSEMDRLFLNGRSTGVRFGGELTDQGAGVIRIAAGEGGLLNNSNPADPIYEQVAWPQSDLDLSGADDIYFVYVTEGGVVSTQTTYPTPQEYRERLFLWRVSIRSGLVSGTTSIVQPVQQYGPQVHDLWRAIGYSKTGQALSAGGSDLSINIAEGFTYVPGINFYNNPEDPHRDVVEAQEPVNFRHMSRTNAQGADRTQFDVGNYDLGGVITAIPGASAQAQIFTCYTFPGSGNYRFFYGQELFPNKQEALNALKTGQHSPVVPENFSEAVLLGWVIASKGDSDFTADGTIFVTSNKFGLIGGASASSAAGALLGVNNLADVNHASTSLANLGGLPRTVEINAQTGLTYTAALSDAGKWITMDNTLPKTFSIPLESSVAFPIGTRMNVSQIGAGVLTIAADAGVTLNGVSGGFAVVLQRYHGVELLKIAADTWIMGGDHGVVA